MEIDIVLLEELDRCVTEIKRKKEKFVSLWKLYSLVDKAFIIIQFATLLYAIMMSEPIIGVILSLYSLSFGNVISRLQKHLNILEKIIPIYEKSIIPEIDNYIRERVVELNIDNNMNVDNLKEAANECHKIEQKKLEKGMGEGFVLPASLRSINCKKITVIIVMYVFCFILIPVIYYKFWKM